MAKQFPGAKGTCWCCGEKMIQDITELCVECEKARMEVFFHVADTKEQEKKRCAKISA